MGPLGRDHRSRCAPKGQRQLASESTRGDGRDVARARTRRPRPLVPLGSAVADRPPAAYLPAHLAGALPVASGRPHLGGGFALRCVQRFSRPDDGYRAMLLAEQLVHRRSVRPGPLVLGAAPRKSPTPTTDRDRTVSRRSEPSSRTALMGEQPNPWEGLPPQDATSRHRGAKPCRRYGLSGKISLLSPG